MGTEKVKESWHLDKKVPIALICTLLMQIGFIVWSISKIDSRIETLERSDFNHKERLIILEKESRSSELRIIRIEDKLTVILDELRGLKTDLKEKSKK